MTLLQAKNKRLRDNSEVIHMMERAVKRMNYAIEAYRTTALPDEAVSMNINQSIETLRQIKRDLNLNNQ